MEQWSAGGMTSSNVKTVAKPSHRIVAVLKSLHFALGEFNCKGSLNIAGIREKLDFACALDPMVSKTDILDLFWHFSIKHVVFAEATFFPSWFYRLARQLKHSALWLTDVKTDQGYQFSYHGPQGTQNSTSHVLLQLPVPFYFTLSHFTQLYTICVYAVPFDITTSHFTQFYTICVYAVPFDITLSHFTKRCTLYLRCTIRHYAEPFHATLHHRCVCYTILHYAEPFDATLHRLCVRCATRHYPEPFDATLHRLWTILQMSAKLFVIELVHFTISCSNSTWATRPFIIWLNYSCLGCSVSRRKTKPSIIWPCHSLISYSILQLTFRPAVYLLIYLTSLYFWWCRPLIWRAQSPICLPPSGISRNPPRGYEWDPRQVALVGQ